MGNLNGKAMANNTEKVEISKAYAANRELLQMKLHVNN